MHIFAIGASRGSGYWISLRLLQRGETVSMLVRSPDTLEKDEAVKQYITSSHLHLYKGDAMKKENVLSSWTTANASGTPVDVVLFAVGPSAKFNAIKGLVPDIPNLCAMTYFNTLLAIASTTENGTPPPKMIVLSAKSTPGSMKVVPLPVRLAAGWMLKQLSIDKRGMETLVFHGWGKEYEVVPEQGILPPNWKDALPAAGWAKNVVLLQPSTLTDGPETGEFRADTKDFFGWSLSRKDLGAYIADRLLSQGDESEWKKCEGEVVTIGY